MGVAEDLKDYTASLGVDFVGCAPVARLAGGPSRTHAEGYLPGVRSVVSLGCALGKAAVDHLPASRTAYQAEHDAVNRRLDDAAHRVAHYLEARGHATLAFDSGAGFYRVAGKAPVRLAADFSHKHAASACGLGFFGVNNLVLSARWGPRIRLASVLTGAQLEPDPAPRIDLCPGQACRACADACPVKALDGWEAGFDPRVGWTMDKQACYSYIFETLEGKRCGLCIQACPIGAPG